VEEINTCGFGIAHLLAQICKVGGEDGGSEFHSWHFSDELVPKLAAVGSAFPCDGTSF
jgi:hypothetical protein